MINRANVLQEQSFESSISQLAKDLDDYKTTSQLQGGTGGLQGALSETTNTWDAQGTYAANFYTHEINITLTSTKQQYPILNPFVDIYVDGYKVSDIDAEANYAQGIDGIVALTNTTDPSIPYVQKFQASFRRWASSPSPYTVRAKAGAYGTEKVNIGVGINTF